ncbi:hypothetical protein AYO22_09222 [Fonsecaea multimorphosa]|nr:hypothetical protein AYO22_09222 [Fonsecaea multimorphosa]
MADHLVQKGIKVIAVGRRQERLDTFVQKHGKERAGAFRFDIRDRENMGKFVQDVTETYPDLDCVFLNAGVQSPINFAHPEKVNLAAFHSEVAVTFSSFVDLTVKFLPFLMNKKTKTSLIFTGSNLAIIPASPLPAYSASKAALSAFVLCLRDQLRNSSSNSQLEAELHDYMGAEKGRALGMPIDQFTEAAFEGLASGSNQIVIGTVGPAEIFNDIIAKRRALSQDLGKTLRGEN